MTTNVPHPLITIGLTCFNAADTIERAIRSAARQTWPNTEIVIVDDCSTDSSVAVVRALRAAIPAIRVIEHATNLGPGGARQTILDNAAGEFLAFFDDDDESIPSRLASQYARVVEYERAHGITLVACYASGTRRYSNGYEMPLHAIGQDDIVPRGAAVADYILHYAKRPGWCYGGTPTCSLMARTSVMRDVGGFDACFRRIEDLDFAVRLALAGGHFVGCSEALFIQYSTGGMDKTPEVNLAAEQLLVEKHKRYLLDSGYYAYARLWPLLRFYHFQRQPLAVMFVVLRLLSQYPLKTIRHLLTTGPKRLMHENRMRRCSCD
ncbi:MAG: glycosyltransferase [Spartobacteria bacterium]|nr:glycosyltransferase [Spartobacteria bacterium]